MLDRRTFALIVPLLIAGARPAAADGLPIIGQHHDGRALTKADVSGWRMVYFGYTHCPDVCPMGLHTMSEAIRDLGPVGERITPVFITVDPERDTPELMKDYTGYFHPRFVGVTPSAEDLKAMAAIWRIKYVKVEGTEGRSYTVDHTASIFLINPVGMIVGRFPHSLDAKEMANKIRGVLLSRP